MIYLHLYNDATGESHFEELKANFTSANYAPPAPPLDVADFRPAAQYGFISMQPGWYGDWHPVPARQVMAFVEGEMEAQASDGEARRLVPGVVLLLEDTTGRGHKSWVVGEKTVTIFVARL